MTGAQVLWGYPHELSIYASPCVFPFYRDPLGVVEERTYEFTLRSKGAKSMKLLSTDPLKELVPWRKAGT